MMRYPRKKASLELSINAIVILILAITILGIGLGFIRTQWTKMGNQLDTISQEMEKHITDRIEESGEILVFDDKKIDIQKGKEMNFYFGVKNTNAEKRQFGFVIRCVQQQREENTIDCDEDIKGGIDVSGEDRWFEMFPTSEVAQGEVKVMIMKLQIPNALPDTYEMRLEVYVGDEDGSEPTGDEEELVTSKTFYIVLR